MESDSDSAARRIVTWDRISGFSHIHNTKMFEITVTTANDEHPTTYHTGTPSYKFTCNTILHAQAFQAQKYGKFFLAQC